MSRKKVLVLGSNFAGLTAAIAVKHELHGDVDVSVLSASRRFLFNPSLIWLPFGKRRASEITFPVEPTFERYGIDFTESAATQIDPVAKKVTAANGDVRDYDYLVVATGYRNRMDVVPGLTPENKAYTITTLEDAGLAGRGWREFLDDPGPIVVGATQSAGCFGAAYEYLFNIAYQVKKAGLRDRVKISFVTSEPFLGHFGIGGLPAGEQLLTMFLKKSGIEAYHNRSVESIEHERLTLTDGTRLDFKYAMIVPPFLGQEVNKTAPGLANDAGYVEVRDTYQSKTYDDVYGIGIAAHVNAPWVTPTPVGVPKTGFPTEQMAHTAARNISSQVLGLDPTELSPFAEMPAFCVMDAGNNGVMILGNKMLGPDKGLMIPGPQSHALKLAFERYFLWKARRGYVQLP
ncbi:FAD-dependent oxidoreductase [Actinotalea sp. M2MS4P-6]|uniref:NAD(P)/FAD-dependent oxidoreductase n=1 Tax=Actinotalea sp. M2MS4P-6 TaxID=2983762 RepID=UPI0021E38FB9|nr:FAD-dependent oxidoreductase [Actinotalea sp. M2MS4P-6]MCV2395230.1 FAD-dependent oxidoreductase [Actinotalea sp. M2MS4P-6]